MEGCHDTEAILLDPDRPVGWCKAGFWPCLAGQKFIRSGSYFYHCFVNSLGLKSVHQDF